jgi:mRNA interferase HigB
VRALIGCIALLELAPPVLVNIKGNDHRLVVAIDSEKSIVWIKWIGTHKDYDKINVKEVQYGR